jgi:hypothetical protein
LVWISEQGRQRTYNVTSRRVRVTIVAVEKQEVLHILSVCVSVALVMQHAKRMCRVILSSVVCPAVPYFSTLFHKQHDFRKKNAIQNKMCALIFSTSFVCNVSHSRENSAKYYHKYSYVPKLTVRYERSLNILDIFSKNIQI